MTKPTRNRTERIEARVAPEQKIIFERAANLRGVTMEEYMVESMHEADVRTIEEHELILSVNEQRTFVDLLLNPPKPNVALRSAALDYFARVAM